MFHTYRALITQALRGTFLLLFDILEMDENLCVFVCITTRQSFIVDYQYENPAKK
jgi:hypothetical protein